MAKLMMTRVDYRLIHGQVAGQWTKSLDVNKVVILDDVTAADEFMLEVFEVIAPVGTEVTVYTVEQGVQEWKENQFGQGRVLVLFREVVDAERAYRLGFQYPSLNVAQSPGRDDRKQAVLTVCLSDHEAELLRGLMNDGVDVYCQMTPVEGVHQYKGILENFKVN